jgi:hypothetical protein
MSSTHATSFRSGGSACEFALLLAAPPRQCQRLATYGQTASVGRCELPTSTCMGQTPGSNGKIAWCLSPFPSGETTVYRVVGAGLPRAGWEVTGFVPGTLESNPMGQRFADK